MRVEDDARNVQAYMRAMCDAPIRRSDDFDDLEAAFVASAKRWANRNAVDSRTLRRAGVAPVVLRRAGLGHWSAAESVRAHYSRNPRSVRQLAALSGVSEAVVRTTLSTDLRARKVERVNNSSGRAVLWRAKRQHGRA